MSVRRFGEAGPVIVSSGVLTGEKIGNPHNCFGVRDLPSPSRHPNQNGPSEYRHDGASHRVPDSNVERIIRGTGEDEDECSPGCGRKRRGKRRPSAVGGRSTSYQYAKCDSWGIDNTTIFHTHCTPCVQSRRRSRSAHPLPAASISQPLANIATMHRRIQTNHDGAIERDRPIGSRRPHRGQQ